MLVIDLSMAPVAIDSATDIPQTEPPVGLGDRIQDMKTLPAQWMRDENIFQLEKRAIFSKVSRTTMNHR